MPGKTASKSKQKPRPKRAPGAVDRRATWRPWLFAAAIVIAVFVAYWPSLRNGLVSDDVYYVEANERLGDAAGLLRYWTDTSASPQYYPLVHTVLWGEYQLWGLEPRYYHAVSMLLHAAVAILFWRLLLRLRVPGAWLAAGIFALHPVHVESVAWISEQKNLLSAALALGSMLAYLRFKPFADAPADNTNATTPRWAWYALALALYAASLLTKSATLSMPAVMLVIAWWKQGRLSLRDLRPLVPFFACGLAMAGITIWVERSQVGAEGVHWQMTPAERVLIAGRAVWFYAAKLVWPYPLVFTYPRWLVDTSDPLQWLFPIAAIALVVALWALRGRIGRGPLAAALIFGGVLLPTLGFFNIFWYLFSFVADHFQYHASMALIALAAAGVVALAERLGPSQTAVAGTIAATILLPLGLRTRAETHAYRDNRSLAVYTVEHSPGSWAGHYRLGRFLQSEGQHDEALEHLREAIRLYPRHPMIRTTIATTLEAAGKDDEAASEFESALRSRLTPDERYDAQLRYGNLLTRREDYERAIAQYRAALDFHPESPDALYNCGQALRAKGDAPAAAEMFARLLTLYPNHAAGHLSLGVVLLTEGKLDSAEKHLRLAIAIDRHSADARNFLGALLAQRGNLPAAMLEFQQALTIDPGHAGARDNLEKARAAARQPAR